MREGPGALLSFGKVVGYDSDSGEKLLAVGGFRCHSNHVQLKPRHCLKQCGPVIFLRLASGWEVEPLLASAFQRNTGMVQGQHFQFHFPVSLLEVFCAAAAGEQLQNRRSGKIHHRLLELFPGLWIVM